MYSLTCCVQRGRWYHDQMITDADVTKLKKTFVTKADIATLKKTFATKKEMVQFEERLNKTFVTKTEFNGLVVRVDGITEKVGDLSVEVGELHEKFDSLDVKFDAMLGLLTDSMQEHGAGAVHLARHDRQIGALATATGVSLPD